jgi:hypothetical protein
LAGALALTMLPLMAQAQNDAPKTEAVAAPEFFRLDFVVKEMESGKALSAHSYQMMVAADEKNMDSIRSGGKVPIPSGDKGQTTYIDIGTNIDVRLLRRVKDEVTFAVTAEISSALEGTTPPVVRQTHWSSSVMVPMRKATVIFATDDPASKHQMMLEVTATPVH